MGYSAMEETLLDGFEEMRRLNLRLRRVSDEALHDLLSDLSEDKMQRVLDAFSALFLWATTECSECLGKRSQGVATCGLCQGSGREDKTATIIRLMQELDTLRQQMRSGG
jgi:DnaJ-class molecular chaperone